MARNMSECGHEVMSGAARIAKERGYREPKDGHVLLALLQLRHGLVPEILYRLAYPVDDLARQLGARLECAGDPESAEALTDMPAEALVKAIQVWRDSGDRVMAGEHFLLAVTYSRSKPVREFLGEKGLTIEAVERELHDLHGRPHLR